MQSQLTIATVVATLTAWGASGAPLSLNITGFADVAIGGRATPGGAIDVAGTPFALQVFYQSENVFPGFDIFTDEPAMLTPFDSAVFRAPELGILEEFDRGELGYAQTETDGVIAGQTLNALGSRFSGANRPLAGFGAGVLAVDANASSGQGVDIDLAATLAPSFLYAGVEGFDPDDDATIRAGGLPTIDIVDSGSGNSVDFSFALQADAMIEIVAGDTRIPDEALPLLPDAVQGDGGFVFDIPSSALLGEDGAQPPTIWIDPEIAVGYTYSAEGAAFASVTAPSLASVPDADGYLLSYDTGGSVIELALSAEETHEFLSPVDQFVISMIDPDLQLDPNDELAFRTGVSFANVVGESVRVVQTPQTFVIDGDVTPVPLPASVWMLSAAVVGLLGGGRIARSHR